MGDMNFLGWRNKLKTFRYKDIENPYMGWDHGLNPRQLLWEMFEQPISQMTDEREYSNGVVGFLSKNGILVDEISVVEKDKKKVEESSGYFALYHQDESACQKFLYKNNLIDVRFNKDETHTLTFFRPLCSPFVVGDFAQWILESKGESKVSILIQANGGLVAKKVNFKAPVISDIELNYGEGFGKVHHKVTDKLNERKASLFLFHGEPGSGKSTYLKYLTTIVDREFIFVPVSLAGNLSSPDFISLLMDKKEAVLILEDAEQAVQARGTGGNDSTVATLLNISDGILGSLLNISIIVTYNADKQHLDKALMRKGRLSFDYDFGPLCVKDAQRLAQHLKKDIKIHKPMTLADIYGAEDDTGYEAQPERKMGFGA